VARRDLVGRDGELGTLLRAAHEAFEGQSTTAVVVGDAGIGKTFLLGVLRDRVEQLGGRVLSGRASEFEALPLGVFLDALDDHLRTLDPGALDELGADALGELAGIFPSLSSGDAQRAAPGADERVSGYIAVRALLDVVARDKPLALVLDDLHWADRSSLELFAFLVRRSPQSRVLLVGSYRPHQVDAEFAADVARATYEGLARYVEVSPLDRAESAQLVGIEDPREAAQLHRATGGNPFFLLALAPSGASASAVGSGGLPPTIARAVTAELDRSGTARAFAEAAAVVGDPFDLDLAIAAAEITDDEGYRAIDQLAERRIIEVGEVPRHFAFRHPLVRQAIYDGLPPGLRLALHERCAAVLTERGAMAADLAHHVEHAARPGDTEAIAVLVEAAREAGSRAPDNAVRWLQAARRLQPGNATDEERLELVRPLPRLHTALGQPQEARKAAVEALALAPDDVSRVAFTLSCVSIEQGLGRYDEAHARLASTLAALDRHSEEAVSVMIAMVIDAFLMGQYDAIGQWTSEAVAEAERLQRPVLAAAANAASALAHALMGATETAEMHLEAALAALPHLTDDDHAARLDVLGGITGAELYLDRYEACVEHGAKGIAIGRATGRMWTAPTLLPSYGCALWVLGRVEDSIRHFDTSLETTRAARHPETIAWALFNLAFAQLVAGRLDEALKSGHESLALAERQRDSVIRTWAGAVVSLAELEGGEPATALDVLYSTCGGPDLPNIPGGWRNHLFEVAVRCHLDLGSPEEAEASAARARAWGDSVKLPYAQSMAHRSTARCAWARGDGKEAVDEALLSVAAADAADARVDAARSRTLAGRFLAELGETEAAVELLMAAASFLDSCGAHRWRDEAERELGRLGRRPHRRTTPGSAANGVASLTAREREIADLVAQRLTNPEIAQRMFLSTKTVETHLRNAFRKLDVSSRGELTRLLESSSAVDPG
jgi:DNA-binding CsgD family transcriptional regulator